MMVYRSRYKEIVFEFAVPEKRQRGIIFLLNGIPSVPRLNDFIEGLAASGYVIVFPRYRGTWESGGIFLSHSPARDVEDLFVHLLKDGNIAELYGHRTFKINTKNLILVGASFGGAVALCAAITPAVKKVIALSPVVDWGNYAGSKTPQAMGHLKRFLRDGFGEAYRFDASGWEKFEHVKLFNPPKKIASHVAKKIIIVQDDTDTAVSPERVFEYARAEKIKIKKMRGYGHISFSRFPVLELLKLIGS